MGDVTAIDPTQKEAILQRFNIQEFATVAECVLDKRDDECLDALASLVAHWVDMFGSKNHTTPAPLEASSESDPPMDQQRLSTQRLSPKPSPSSVGHSPSPEIFVGFIYVPKVGANNVEAGDTTLGSQLGQGAEAQSNGVPSTDPTTCARLPAYTASAGGGKISVGWTVVLGQEQVGQELVHWYTELLGGVRRNQRMDLEPFRPFLTGIVAVQHQERLTQEVSDAKIKRALFDIEDEKAPGPDDYMACFFKKVWAVVGTEITNAIKKFFRMARC
ncbi:hypothetical protein Salat_2903900 [Sesamum alatum]|uniref:Uncharacterized protein n=1 Tax=Sesamum alatum TaxID=300844 RepID=A0AAE1XIV0_9LAMI|nr:hypothetical protein Salat_2903900 [Sesamum alatum]